MSEKKGTDPRSGNQVLLQQLERQRRRVLLKKRITTIIAAAIVAWLTYSAFSFGYRFAVDGQEMLIGLMFGVIVLVFTSVMAYVTIKVATGSGRNKISSVFKDKIVRQVLANVFEDVVYEPGGRFSDEEVRGLKMVRGVDRITGNDLIHAKRGGVPFSQCDLRIEERVKVEDADGKTRTEMQERFSGTLVRIQRPQPYPARVVLCTDKMQYINSIQKPFPLSALFGGKTDSNEVVTESAAFNRRYDLASEDQIAARVLFTPHRMEAFMALDKALKKEYGQLPHRVHQRRRALRD